MTKLEINLRELWHCSCCDNDFVSSSCPSSVEMVWCTDDIMLTTSEGFEDLETITESQRAPEGAGMENEFTEAQARCSCGILGTFIVWARSRCYSLR